jgi:hypothetical protein
VLKPGANYVHPCGMIVVKILNIFYNAITLTLKAAYFLGFDALFELEDIVGIVFSLDYTQFVGITAIIDA